MRTVASIFEHGEYRITIENSSNGEIGITVTSIEELIKCVLRENRWIYDYKLSSRIKHKHLYIKAKIFIETDKDIMQDLSDLQKLITDRVKVITGVKIAELNLLVSDIKYEKNI